jgi:glutamate racemase
MDNANSAPIGIFDSGIGGLTVAQAIHRQLPKEKMVYFGDTAHLPYGEKSAPAIQAYSVKITDVLIKEGCKVIIIACNSASSAAYELLKEYSGSKSKIINVIDPMVDYVASKHSNERVGLIGTKQTVLSNIYKNKLEANGNGVDLVSLATPLLVPMIEEGFIHDKISHDVIEEYLSHKELDGIGSLILGCTHYPLIKDEIEDFYGGDIEVMASSDVVARELKNWLQENDLMYDGTTEDRTNKFLVSDFTDSFEASSKHFFGESIHLEQFKLWE